MEKNRVDCYHCKNFIHPVFEEKGNLFSKITENEKCSLGKRIMLRVYEEPNKSDSWFRYCDEFNDK